MVITKEILFKNGFKTDHPERVLCKYKKHGKNPEYLILIEQDYKSMSNELTYNVSCWITDDKGAIKKRSSLSNVKTIEELNDIIQLCNIDFKLNGDSY